jgi:hypothetical protein
MSSLQKKLGSGRLTITPGARAALYRRRLRNASHRGDLKRTMLQ